jgi:glycosyltransferase involved in cell wall biosynthesis
VAVCTNRPPHAVAGALDALSADAPSAPRAVVTSGLSAEAVEAHRRAAPGWTVLAESRPGLSRARNRALAWTEGDDEVIAFVDDDALVHPGWHVALTRRWAEAPETVACIGGPIVPSYSVAPPTWLSDAILPALTVLDRGDTVRDLEGEEAVYGANISFRAGPLRRAGGFDPAWGHSGARTYFGEEDEAQRALRRLGYTTRYVPDAKVDHVIPADRLTRRAFVERRYAFGRALGARAGRSRALAARQVVAAAAGVVLARDERKRMERAVRGAENLGALTARRGRA